MNYGTAYQVQHGGPVRKTKGRNKRKDGDYYDDGLYPPDGHSFMSMLKRVPSYGLTHGKQHRLNYFGNVCILVRHETEIIEPDRQV